MLCNVTQVLCSCYKRKRTYAAPETSQVQLCEIERIGDGDGNLQLCTRKSGLVEHMDAKSGRSIIVREGGK